jgi:SAM-dependent methyltransferase
MRDTDKDWSKVAESDPYWGVISNERFRGRDISLDDKAAFFSSGNQYISDILGFVKRNLKADFRIDRGLDFGCGVGRLLLPLARVSKEAVGVDVAPRMLEIAKENLVAEGLVNAFVVLGTDDLANVEGEFNFINSYIVFQHIPPERGMELLARLLQRLTKGGVFSIQLTFAKERRHREHEGRTSKYFRRIGNLSVDLVTDQAKNPEGTITMFEYDLNEVFALLSEVVGHPLLVLPTNHDGHLGTHLIGMRVR